MDKITVVVVFLGVLIFSSHLFNKMFQKTKVPNVLLLMIIGIIGGLFIDKDLFFGEVGRVFTTITLVIILFESGTELKFAELKSTLLSSLGVTLLSFFFSTLLIIGVLTIFTDLDFLSSLFLGSILGGTSSAVVIPLVKQLKMKEKSGTILLLESAFTDVLCLIVGLAALEGMKAGDLDASTVMSSMWKSFFFAFFIGIFSGFVWNLLLGRVRSINNSMFMTLAFVFIVYGCTEMLGYNGGIASLCFGVILGNSDTIGKTKAWNHLFKFDIATLNDNEKAFFSEIVFVLQTYFFVYVGVVIEFGNIMTYFIALLIVVLILLARPIVIMIFTVKSDIPRYEKSIMSVMAPKGLVPAILASMPLQYGLAAGNQIAEIGYAVVLLSIVICSFLIIMLSKNPDLFTRSKKVVAPDEANIPVDEESEIVDSQSEEEDFYTETLEAVDENQSSTNANFESSTTHHSAMEQKSEIINSNQTKPKRYIDEFED